MSGFDRIKPPERRLLEREESRQPDSREADKQGRAALFSASEPVSTPGAGVPRGARRASPPPAAKVRVGDDPTPSSGTQQPGAPRSAKAEDVPMSAADPRLPTGRSALQVECGHCGVTCPLPLGHALRQAVPLVVLAPWKSHPVFATCPCGERRAWLKPRLGLPR